MKSLFLEPGKPLITGILEFIEIKENYFCNKYRNLGLTWVCCEQWL